jgi:DNA polymerase
MTERMRAADMLERALRWQIAAGADDAVLDEPTDRFAVPAPPVPPVAVAPRPAPPPPSPPPPSPPPARPPAAIPEAIAAARAAAAAATTLDGLRQAVEAFDGCALKRTATNTVFADGNPRSGLMLIGEAPGADEDRIGRPFVGASGQLLDRMLATIGIDRTGCYITNVMFWRPPGNRKPTDFEIDTCRPFVERHIALVRPRLLVIVGATASGVLLPGSEGITRLRGRWLKLEVNGLAAPLPAMAVYHPSFLLRSPERKRESWSDLLSIKSKLQDIAK